MGPPWSPASYIIDVPGSRNHHSVIPTRLDATWPSPGRRHRHVLSLLLLLLVAGALNFRAVLCEKGCHCPALYICAPTDAVVFNASRCPNGTTNAELAVHPVFYACGGVLSSCGSCRPLPDARALRAAGPLPVANRAAHCRVTAAAVLQAVALLFFAGVLLVLLTVGIFCAARHCRARADRRREVRDALRRAAARNPHAPTAFIVVGGHGDDDDSGTPAQLVLCHPDRNSTVTFPPSPRRPWENLAQVLPDSASAWLSFLDPRRLLHRKPADDVERPDVPVDDVTDASTVVSEDCTAITVAQPPHISLGRQGPDVTSFRNGNDPVSAPEAFLLGRTDKSQPSAVDFQSRQSNNSTWPVSPTTASSRQVSAVVQDDKSDRPSRTS